MRAGGDEKAKSGISRLRWRARQRAGARIESLSVSVAVQHRVSRRGASRGFELERRRSDEAVRGGALASSPRPRRATMSEQTAPDAIKDAVLTQGTPAAARPTPLPHALVAHIALMLSLVSPVHSRVLPEQLELAL